MPTHQTSGGRSANGGKTPDVVARRLRAAYGPIASHFRPRRHRLTAAAYRETRAERFATWRAVTGTSAMA